MQKQVRRKIKNWVARFCASSIPYCASMTASMGPTALKSRRRYWVQNPLNVISPTLFTSFVILGVAPSTVLALEAMLSLSIACLSGFILAALTLTVAPQDSIAGSSDTWTSSSSPLQMLSPSNQSMSSSKESFPAPLAPLPANMAALKALGLDTDEPISWETTPSGAMIRVQCNIQYGRRLDYQDCRDAYRQIPRSNETVARFAHRQSGRPYDVALPQRYLGSRSSRQEHDSSIHFTASMGEDYRH